METTILLAYTLTRLVEPDRHNHAASLVSKLNAGEIAAVTSFCTLHEVLLLALKNAPNLAQDRQLGKEALLTILQTRIEILPLITREEKILNARTFSVLRDPSDVSHAIATHLAGCQIIVSYDEHFRDLPPLLLWKRPEELLSDLQTATA